MVQPANISSGKQGLENLAEDVRQAEIAPLEFVSQLGVVEPQRLQNCGVQVVHVYRVLGDIEAQGDCVGPRLRGKATQRGEVSRRA